TWHLNGCRYCILRQGVWRCLLVFPNGTNHPSVSFDYGLYMFRQSHTLDESSCILFLQSNNRTRHLNQIVSNEGWLSILQINLERPFRLSLMLLPHNLMS